MMSKMLLVLAALATAASGCVSRADFERMRREHRETRARLADMQVAVDRVQRKVDARSEDDTAMRTRAAVQSLEGRLSALERATEKLAEKMRTRQTQVAGPGVIAGLPAGVPRTQAATIAWSREIALLQAGGVDPTYQRGLQLYREGQTEQAIRALREFLGRNQTSELADNAQYWLGEAYYSRGDYNRAIIELNEVLLKHPQGDQIPGALLALATAFANSGDPIDARLILQKLIGDHPDSSEAKVGRQQLQALADR